MGTLFANLQAALRSLREHRQLALLSAVGISVGSVAIILLISIAKGVQADITRQVNDLGVNLLVVLPGRISEGSMFAPNLAGVSYLKDEDLYRSLKVPGVRRAAPLMFVGGGISNGKKDSQSTMIIAAGAEWFNVRKADLAAGRFYTPQDENRKVCVIGSVAHEQLFDNKPAIGKKVTINGVSYEVLGITRDNQEEESMFSMGGLENIAYIPYEVAKKVVPNPQLHRIMIQTEPDREPKELVASVENALAERLDKKTFSVLTQKDLLKLVYKVMNIFTWMLTALTSIALFVGGLGIMTVMLMSVNERAQEIGIRKAVGARTTDIFVQFFCEAVVLAVLGGTAGLAFSYLVVLALDRWTPIHPLITLDVVALSFGVSTLVGAVFGLIPALGAAKKDPVVALRH